ncbi:MAG: hypothetical protein RMI56_00970 [Sulfolobales archaeon]|nr:hypothetical protein [Sulfolobales archaeon]MDW8082351.1 hypothetical protein [Sulfolobales archaeon]
MLKALSRVIREMKFFVRGIREAMIEESVSVLKAEYIELENVFLLIVLGPLVGIKTITPLLSLELLEPLISEIRILESRSVKGEDVLDELVSSLGGAP